MMWRLIESAPKDGTPILSWDGKTRAVIAWSTRDRRWFLDDNFQKPFWDSPPPTHWMALEDPPT